MSASQISMSFRFSLEGFGHEGFALVALDDSAEGNAEGICASGGGCLGYGDHLECGSEGHTLFWDGWLSSIPMSMLGTRQKEIIMFCSTR